MDASGTAANVDDGLEWDEGNTCVWMPVETTEKLSIDYDNLKIVWDIDQQYYIESLQHTFGPEMYIMSVDYVVPDIAFKSRVVNFNPSNITNRLIDPINIVIRSSNEKPSDFCDILNHVALDQEQTESQIYYIDHLVERDNFYLQTKFVGFEELSDECQANIQLTLDTKLPNGDWLPVFWTDLKQIDELTENEDYNMYFFRVSQQFVYLSVKYDLQDYIGIVLPRYQKKLDVTQINAEIRISMRVGDEVVLSDEFQLEIIPRNIVVESPCADSIATYS